MTIAVSVKAASRTFNKRVMDCLPIAEGEASCSQPFVLPELTDGQSSNAHSPPWVPFSIGYWNGIIGIALRRVHARTVVENSEKHVYIEFFGTLPPLSPDAVRSPLCSFSCPETLIAKYV